ncbi:MAG: 50S ribosomal protein L22 [bacterium]|nr:50S ribosomal protein L22 [bacterium]
MKTQTAKLKYLKISPRKTRLVADLIKGLRANEAEAQLLFLPNRASKPILKLLRSAMANAKNNQQLNVEKLLVKEIRVDIGPSQKRWRTRARGAMSPIAKKSCHISLVLEESDKEIPLKYKFIPKPKKAKKEKSKKRNTEKALSAEKQEKSENVKSEKQRIVREAKPEKVGAFRKFFRRKAI